jgi:hypothetical protein
MRTVEQYEHSQAQHRGHSIGIARHGTCAPFACNAPLALGIESNPMRHVAGERLIIERCQGCGKVVNVWPVVHEIHLVNNDDADDCA